MDKSPAPTCTKIFEEITYEGEVYADLSNDGADALADYFIGH